MNTTTAHNIHDRVRQVAADIAAKVRDGSITVDESEALHTDDGLIVDGVAAWHVAGEIRTFTRCTSCDTYAEYAQKIRLS